MGINRSLNVVTPFQKFELAKVGQCLGNVFSDSGALWPFAAVTNGGGVPDTSM